MLPEQLTLVLTTLLRYLIVGASAWLISHKVIDDGTASALSSPSALGALATAVGTIVYALYLRLKSRYTTKVALQNPKGTSIETVKAQVNETPVSTIVSLNP